MKSYLKKAMIWYALFLALIISVAVYLDAPLSELLQLAVAAFFICLLMPIAWKIALFVIKIMFKIVWFFLTLPFKKPIDNGTKPVKVSNTSSATSTQDKPQKTKSSGVAKAAFALGALALARSSKPSKVPQAVSRDLTKARNFSCQPISGKDWLVTYEYLHPSPHIGWEAASCKITRDMSGFTTPVCAVDVHWR